MAFVQTGAAQFGVPPLHHQGVPQQDAARRRTTPSLLSLAASSSSVTSASPHPRALSPQASPCPHLLCCLARLPLSLSPGRSTTALAMGSTLRRLKSRVWTDSSSVSFLLLPHPAGSQSNSARGFSVCLHVVNEGAPEISFGD